jgi:hypothetical protein
MMFYSNNIGHSLVDVVKWSYKLNMLCIVLSFVFDYSAVLYTMLLLIVEACALYHMVKRAILGEEAGIMLIVYDVYDTLRSTSFDVIERIL